MTTKVLLDFDGILFNNNKIHDIVKHKSVEYVSHKLNTSTKNATLINKYHYKKYGHSIIHLPNSDIVSYNKYVFENLNKDVLKKHLNDDDKERMNIFFELGVRCPNVEQYLFTSAPFTYCNDITSLLGFDLFELVDINVFTSDITSNKIDNNFIKPYEHTYKHVESFFAKNDIPYDLLNYIDDNITNIEPLKYNKRWNPILIKPCSTKETKITVNNIYSTQMKDIQI